MNRERDVLADLVRAVGRRSTPPDEDYDYVFEAAKRSWENKVRSRRRSKWLLAAAAATVTFGLSLASFMHWMPRKPPLVVASVSALHGRAGILVPGESAWRELAAGAHVPAGAKVRTGATSGLALTLTQGQSVRIDQRSEITVESQEAMRLLVGAVYVDSGVEPQTSSLRIDTNIGTVRDVGTIFEVRSTFGEVRVRVREGTVSVDASSRGLHLESLAGEELIVDDLGTVSRAKISASDPEWAWAAALATPPESEGWSLLQFLTWVSRETGRIVEFQEPELEGEAREVILHGKTRGLSPLEALDLMLSTTDLEYVLPTDESIVIRRRRE
jgi:ferric-dicitrate binding protein FerR (iron transport regulator)